MRLIVSMSILCIGLGLSLPSYGQEKPQNSETAETAESIQSEQSEQSEIKVETETPSSDKKEENDDEAFNIDRFFKKAEENAEKGFNCEKAPVPIS